jgi:hypothetical protein
MALLTDQWIATIEYPEAVLLTPTRSAWLRSVFRWTNCPIIWTKTDGR